MILEVATSNIKKGLSNKFEESFKEASNIIVSMKGYISHELKKCLEHDDKYLLLVNWETVEDHEIGFRKSEEHKEWKRLLHHYYESFPTVEHYK